MYNWADPRRNSSISVKMMEKAEAARKQRLTKVRPTVSNHLHPAVEKKLPKKHEKLTAAELYMGTLGDSNQEESPFSVHNVVATESSFHPESTIEAFQGLKKAKPHGDEDPAWSDLKPQSRLTKSRVKSEDKLPSLQKASHPHASKARTLATTRSDPEISNSRRPNQEPSLDALDMYDDGDDELDDDDDATEEHPCTEAAAVVAGPVPKLDLKPLSRRSERKDDAKPKLDKKLKAKKEGGASLKARGTSLAQLKDEHRAALELLKELGGAYPSDEKDPPLSSRFGAKLRSTVHSSRDVETHETVKDVPSSSSSAPSTSRWTDDAKGDGRHHYTNEAEDEEEVPETCGGDDAPTPEKGSEFSYGSEEFETD
ncbi:hypothetical protein SPRG_08782 [Saprolegnia parasitica CBS 223.65]|uniref:Uncharacterized protein n=1 Tax=Saprolegnia parasitica (strain CBS 223.65) TaxID=695850 RepID=A0A067C5Q1_SAPPC|nr:hypothetical protein SPRG_08782 [Saprolegnia parasitica CBS 223.65]KDO25838.1 hypothetical protein SPRG_08782 [Saprolegnia parasitica CBS 223.65]|eukprot:XP_012203402.1 hypothetical protein SPRG_08782 [Saprolegnia parasitica CBS 223.65]